MRGPASARGLITEGATRLYEMEEMGQYWIVLQDPERNEFCVT